MSASRSARVMLLCINGKSRGAGGDAGLGASGLLFAVVVAILNHDGALAVFPFQGPLVGRERYPAAPPAGSPRCSGTSAGRPR